MTIESEDFLRPAESEFKAAGILQSAELYGIADAQQIIQVIRAHLTLNH